MTSTTCVNSKPATPNTALCIGHRSDGKLRLLFLRPLHEEDFEPTSPIFASSNAANPVGQFFQERPASKQKVRRLIAVAAPLEVRLNKGECRIKLPVVLPPDFQTDLNLSYKHSQELMVYSPVFPCNAVFGLPLTNADPHCSLLPTGPFLLLSRHRFEPGMVYLAWVSLTAEKVVLPHPRRYQKLGSVLTWEKVVAVNDVKSVHDACLPNHWLPRCGVVVQVKGESCVILELSLKGDENASCQPSRNCLVVAKVAQGTVPLKLGDCVKFYAISISANFNQLAMAIACQKLCPLFKPIDEAAGLLEFGFRFQPERYSCNVYNVPRIVPRFLNDSKKKLAQLATNQLKDKEVAVSLMCDVSLEAGTVVWQIVDLLELPTDSMSTSTSSSKLVSFLEEMRAIAASGVKVVEDECQKLTCLPSSPPSSFEGSSWMSGGDRASTSTSSHFTSSSKPASSRSRGFNYEINEENEEQGFGSDQSSSSTPPCMTTKYGSKYTDLSSKGVIFLLKGDEVVVLVLNEDNFKWKRFWTKKRQLPFSPVVGQWYQLSYDIIGKTRAHLKVYASSYKISAFIPTRVIQGRVNFRTSVTQCPTPDQKRQYKCDFGSVDMRMPRTIELFNKCYLLQVAVWCTPSDQHPQMFALTAVCAYEDKTVTKAKPPATATREGVGVVCVMLSFQLFHVFSNKFVNELMLDAESTFEADEHKRQLDLGVWVHFSAREQDGIWMIFSFKVMKKPGYHTLPCMGKIYMECPVEVPENYAASKARPHLQAEFGSRVWDDRKLLKDKEKQYWGTVLSTTITYVHKEDQLSGYWCLEYIKCIFSY